MKAYPIKFEPILKEKVWGGSKLSTVLNKVTTNDSIGESWEISGVENNLSQVQNGTFKGSSILELVENHKEKFVGRANYERFGNEFPLLIKFLDAKTNLSVQVHPDDDMARIEHNSFGKTEMWYIMDHDEDAEIIVGLKDKDVDTDILANIDQTNVFDVFNTEKVARGDAFFIPAGKVHAIGAGVLAAEIQQTSDITYRVYDWDRTDDLGNRRELHIDKSINATKKFNEDSKKDFSVHTNATSNIVESEFFTTNIFQVNKTFEKDYASLDSFVVLMCLEGSANVTVNKKTESVIKGETILLPASALQTSFDAREAKFLEVFIAA
jgi:mannose-6-phosphate isomerase